MENYGRYQIIVDGIKFDAQAINNYLSLVKGAPFDENLLPACFMSFLSHPIDSSMSSNGLPTQKVLSWTQHLAEIVLTFGHVEDVRGCADLPIVFVDFLAPLGSVAKLLRDSSVTAELEAHDIFHALVELVAPAQIDLRDDNPKFTSRLTEGLLFLCSDFGWSVFLSTVDNKDPAEIRPELVKVCKGTPTKINTNERRLRIRDGLGRITVYYPEYATIQ